MTSITPMIWPCRLIGAHKRDFVLKSVFWSTPPKNLGSMETSLHKTPSPVWATHPAFLHHGLSCHKGKYKLTFIFVHHSDAARLGREQPYGGVQDNSERRL